MPWCRLLLKEFPFLFQQASPNQTNTSAQLARGLFPGPFPFLASSLLLSVFSGGDRFLGSALGDALALAPGGVFFTRRRGFSSAGFSCFGRMALQISKAGKWIGKRKKLVKQVGPASYVLRAQYIAKPLGKRVFWLEVVLHFQDSPQNLIKPGFQWSPFWGKTKTSITIYSKGKPDT